EAAFQRDIPIVPILLGGARMPREDQLPESIRGLASRQAANIRPGDYDRDLEALARSLATLLELSANGREDRVHFYECIEGGLWADLPRIYDAMLKDGLDAVGATYHKISDKAALVRELSGAAAAFERSDFATALEHLARVRPAEAPAVVEA